MEYESGSCNLSFLGSCKCKKQLFVISIFSGCSLLDIFERLGKKCAETTPEAMILQYVAPQHKMNVTLNDDDDVLNMIHLYMCMKLSMIELRAESKNEHVRNQNIRRHPGIIKAVNLLFTGSHHAYCLRHLVDNFVKVVLRSYPKHNKKHWSSVFKKAAYAPSLQEHEQHIKNILESMPLARDFIVNSEPQSWANALFLGNRWGVINNNIAECWNNWVKAARYLPIVGMVDHIRVQIMNMMHERRESTAIMVKELSPKKEKAIGSVYVESRKLRVHRSCNWRFEVVDGEKSFAIDLIAMTCSCRYWQINKLPCKHACAAIESKSMSFYDFCDKYFKIEMYRQTYRGIINPIPTFDINESYLDDGNVINAPDVRSQPGRRKAKRIPSQIESRVSKCSRCHKGGQTDVAAKKL
ncbi:uncharacterized protein LOC142523241 [Primulina tabacum]|uniref:uncharacterized protein LOC142523241 n=1 Tax=Primulina tabacum TaxID=48773 RepID=UPI003F59C3F2